MRSHHARRSIISIALACATATPLGARAQQPWDGLEEELRARIARHDGTVGVAVIEPMTGRTLGIGENEPFPSASLIKVPILIELFHQVEHGELRLDDPLIVLEVDKQPGSGVLQFLDAPHRLSVRDAAFLMIALSDNTATNLLIDELGIRAVNERMDSIGAPRTTLHSKTFLRSTSIALDSSEVYGLGVTTPLEMARLLAQIQRGEAVSDSASAAMRALLADQFYGFGIPRYLSDVSVAHKTGDLSAARHDCGIVDTTGRDFVLCVLTKENADQSWRVDNEAHLLIADLARIVHRRFEAASTS
ncbi:MAG: serine hydrolase [Longimicrobiales bacterium]